jgi:CubicO group peptidase (beta-lactamase class C family)
MEIPLMLRGALLAIVGTAGLAQAQSSLDASGAAAPSMSTVAAARWIDSVFAAYASPTSPGCAVGVTRNGSLLLAKGYGMSDVAAHVAITPDTRFNIASLSKQFTAMSVVLLAQDGRLSLDDSVRRWIPELPSFGKTITIRELLNHTSGLRDYMTLLAVSGWSDDSELTEQQVLDLLHRQRSLNFDPGDEFLYSNTGYVLLSLVVRRASGESLRDFAAARIFAPLGMTETEFRDDHNIHIENRAVGYESAGDAMRPSEPRTDVVGDGGVYSTVSDLAKWDANFVSGRVGGAQAIAMLEQPGKLNNGQTIPYGLALAIGRVAGMRTVGHSGSYGGYRATMLRFPDAGLGVITLCNTTQAATPALAEQVGTLMLGVVPKPAAVSALDLTPSLMRSGAPPSLTDVEAEARRRNDQLVPLAGAYYSDELDLPVTLVVRDGALVLERPRASDIRFGLLATDLFSSSDKILLRVQRDDRGAVTGFALSINRVRDLEFARRPTP